MARHLPSPSAHHGENPALNRILKNTAAATGEAFFTALVQQMAAALKTRAAWVTELLVPRRQLRTLAFYADGQMLNEMIIDIDGTPCGDVIEEGEWIHFEDNIIAHYPENHTLKAFNAASYMGVPLWDTDHRVMGHLAVMDSRPMPQDPNTLKIFHLFAARAAAELQRTRAEQAIRKREERYRRIVETAAEGFVLLDRDHKIMDVNAAFCKLIGYEREALIGKRPRDFYTDANRKILRIGSQRPYQKGNRSYETTIFSKSGKPIPVLVHNSTLRDDQAESIGEMAFITDLTTQKKSLMLAAEIQKSLLPKERPQVPGFDIDGRTISCDEIGGDYFDFFWDRSCQNDQFSIVVGDALGHGVDAALIMTAARTILHVSDSQCSRPADIVSDLNEQLAGGVLDTDRFMTLFVLKILPSSGELRWIRAGHDPAVVFDPDRGRFAELRGAGMALGIDKGYHYREYRTGQLKKGQVIALGTDGIWEATDRDGDMYGKQRFQDVIRQNAARDATAIIDAVYEDLNRFCAGTDQADDITLVIVKVDNDFNNDADWSI
jgi:PAS domain S-box-containing protein